MLTSSRATYLEIKNANQQQETDTVGSDYDDVMLEYTVNHPQPDA